MTDSTPEASVYINGVLMLPAHAMTIRVALGNFIMDLESNGLGDDHHWRAMTKAYTQRAREILEEMRK